MENPIAENGWGYKYCNSLVIKPTKLGEVFCNRELVNIETGETKIANYSSLTMKILDLFMININNQIFKGDYKEEGEYITFCYDLMDFKMDLGSDSDITTTRLNKEIVKLMSKVFTYTKDGVIQNYAIIPYSAIDTKSKNIYYRIHGDFLRSFMNGYISVDTTESNKPNYIAYDKTKIFSKKLKQSTNILFRMLHSDVFAIKNGTKIYNREFIQSLFGSSYDKIAMEEKRFFDDAIEELKSLGLLVRYSRVYENRAKTKLKGWKFCVFYDKNLHEKVKGVNNDWLYLDEKTTPIFDSFDKGCGFNKNITIKNKPNKSKEEILNIQLLEFQQANEDGYVTPKIDPSMESYIRYKKEMAEKQNKSMKEVKICKNF